MSTAVFCLAQGCVLYHPVEHTSKHSLPRLYHSFFHPAFQCRQSLCSGSSPWTALDHVTTYYHQTELSLVAETLLYQGIATPNGPGVYLALRIPCKQLCWFACQCSVHILQLWRFRSGVVTEHRPKDSLADYFC